MNATAAVQPRPTLRMASRSVFAGSSPTAPHSSQNSSTVGLPLLASRRSITLGALTPSRAARALSEGGDSIASLASNTMRMTSRSRALHSRLLLGMAPIVRMLSASNKRECATLDKALAVANIETMKTLATTNNMTEVQIAITYLELTANTHAVTRQALAARLGVTRQTVSARFDRKAMELDDFIATADALGLTPSDVLATARTIRNESTPALADPERSDR